MTHTSLCNVQCPGCIHFLQGCSRPSWRHRLHPIPGCTAMKSAAHNSKTAGSHRLQERQKYLWNSGNIRAPLPARRNARLALALSKKQDPLLDAAVKVWQVVTCSHWLHDCCAAAQLLLAGYNVSYYVNPLLCSLLNTCTFHIAHPHSLACPFS
jgi:hypothetical protein